MTVIRPNSVSGITSITAQANEINFFRSNGALAGLQLNGVNFNTTTGVSTFNNLNVGGVLTYQDVTNVDSVGIITARSNIDCNGDLDVDGHTELDNVNIVGVTTHNGTTNLYGNGGASVVWGNTGYTGHLSFDADSNAVIRAASGKALIFQTNHVNEKLRITSTGQLLVGTSSASNRFKNGNGNGATPKFQFETANVDEQNDISLTFGRNNAFGAEIILAKHRAATVGGYTVVQSGDRLGGINFAGSDGAHFRPAALIQSRVDGTPGTADMPGRLEFHTTADGAATPTERLRITSSGSMGLGTNNPNDTLHVYHATDNLVARFESGDTGGGITLKDNTHVTSLLTTNGAFEINVDQGGDISGETISFKMSGTEKLRVTSSDVTINGTTDGVLNLNTTDSRGSFMRFQQNGTSKCFVGCAQGLGSGDQDDLGLRTTDNILFLIGSTEEFKISGTNGRLERTFGGGSGSGSDLDGMWFNNDTATGGTFVRFWQTSGSYGANQIGSISHSANNTSFNTSSDYRLKENAVAISDGITRLKTLKPYRFNFKTEPSKTVDGFFAHEAATVVPEAVTGTKDEVATADDDAIGQKKGDPIHQGMDYAKITPLLTAALQEAIAKIETLEAEVAALKGS